MQHQFIKIIQGHVTCSYRKKRKILIGTHYFVYVQFDYARKDIVNKMFSRIIVKFVGFILAVFPYTLLLLRILKNGWSKVFKVIPRNKPPKALSDPSLGRHAFITTEDGISLIDSNFYGNYFHLNFQGYVFIMLKMVIVPNR